jgi:DNA-binding transcriptional MocR family regulator
MPSHYDAQGYPPLREAIAKRLSARGLDVEPDEVVITTGSQQSLDIVARSLAVKRIALESPVYAYAKLLFETLGHDLVGLHLDPFGGIDLALWERQLATRPSLAYLISSFHNPTGYSYTSAELRGVLDICQRHGVAILEDDWGSDMLSDGEYRPMLRMLGGKDVLYVNSFTKKLLPSLRVGFVAAAPQLVPTLVAMKRLSTLGNAWLTEAIVAEFLDRGYYDTHLQALQRAPDAVARSPPPDRSDGARGAPGAAWGSRVELERGVSRRAAPARLSHRVRLSARRPDASGSHDPRRRVETLVDLAG